VVIVGRHFAERAAPQRIGTSMNSAVCEFLLMPPQHLDQELGSKQIFTSPGIAPECWSSVGSVIGLIAQEDHHA
jgi:hypothetical protein